MNTSQLTLCIVIILFLEKSEKKLLRMKIITYGSTYRYIQGAKISAKLANSEILAHSGYWKTNKIFAQKIKKTF
jgi:hypothetical protein